MNLVRRARPPRFALVITLVAFCGCERSASQPVSPTPTGGVLADSGHASCDAVLASLQAGNRDALLAVATSPLTEELDEYAFSHASAAVQWLGQLQSREIVGTEKTVEGGRRRYALTFDQGEVELELDLAGNKVMGFRFVGELWSKAELGAETVSYDEFKVYGIEFHDAEGNIADPNGLSSRELSYVFVLGGMMEMMGEHHVTVKARVEDSNGKDVFLRPIVYETVFAKNPEGIPRGDVRGDLKVGGPGQYELVLEVADDVGHQHTEFKIPFMVRGER